jgi:hypothetical protein
LLIFSPGRVFFVLVFVAFSKWFVSAFGYTTAIGSLFINPLVLSASTATVLVSPVFISPSIAAGKTIKINFDSTEEFIESDGVKGKSIKSTFTEAEKKTIIDKIQKQYDDSVGAGKIMVMEGSGGDVDMIVNGGKAPGVNEGREYGDAGKPGKPGIVHQGEFNLVGADLVNAIEETIAHEIGHKLGLNHNWDKPPTKMTEGGKVSIDIRKKGERKFNSADAKGLNKNLANSNSEQKDTVGSIKEILVHVGDLITPLSEKPDDTYLNTYAIFQSNLSYDFGYMSWSDEFVFVGDFENTSDNPAFLTLIYDGGLDLAVRSETGDIFSLSDGWGEFYLTNQNPYNPAVFLTSKAVFKDPGFSSITLNVLAEETGDGCPPGLTECIVRTTGGFKQVPGPLPLFGLATAFGISRKIRRKLQGSPKA